MNISKENIDALNAVVTIEVEKSDIEPRVEEVLKNYRKKASIPGFRPGHVPAGMIKKMYGTSALADEMNKLVGETLDKYITENDINVLGQPLPSEKMEPIDFDKEQDKYEFKFDLGIAPAFDLELNDKLKFTYYKLEITDEALDQQVKAVTSRFGKHEQVEAVGEHSMVKCSVIGEYSNEDAVISATVMKDDAEKAKLLGKKVGEEVSFDIRKAFPNDTEISYILGVSKEDAANAKGDYKFTIKEITDFKDPELTQELFDQIYGKDSVKTVDEFKARVKADVEKLNSVEENYRFGLDVKKAILDKLSLELPEAFLKRWLTLVNRENDKFTPDTLEAEFPTFVDDLKWQVVKNSIMKANDLKLDNDAMVTYAKEMARMQFAQYGMTTIPEDYIEGYAKNLVEKKEEREHIVEGAVNNIVCEFIKSKTKITEKKISRDEFMKLFEK